MIDYEKRRKMMKGIVEFVMAEAGCDIDILRKAMYCQVSYLLNKYYL